MSAVTSNPRAGETWQHRRTGKVFVIAQDVQGASPWWADVWVTKNGGIRQGSIWMGDAADWFRVEGDG